MRRDASAELLSARLDELTRSPHPAGSDAGERNARFIAAELRRFGYQVETHAYEVLLPRPERLSVDVLAPFAFSASMREEAIDVDPDTAERDILPPHHAFSPDGDVTAPVVYANYGRSEDFVELERRGVEVKGTIVLMRYGKNFRGSKVQNAAERGAAGAILYSDPADDGFKRGDVYPRGPFRPESAVERGSTLKIFDYPGDPGTPGRPSLPGALQLTFEEMGSLPLIPSLPLSAADARPMLEALDGPVAADDWQGGLPFPYHLGGGRKVKIRMVVENDWSLRRIVDVVGTLPGLQYPDEEIIAGNHRDAWVRGAIDPCSGTAVLLEVARLVGEAARSGAAPDRTLRFAFWDAEEYGLIGSTEWGEEFEDRLTQRAVAYLNIDSAVSGKKLRLAGSPQLQAFTRDFLGSVPAAAGATELGEVTRPDGTVEWSALGSGSDFTVFAGHLGVAALDLAAGGAHGVYHSTFDTFSFVKRHIDPGFVQHRRIAGIAAGWLHRLSREEILPWDFAALGRSIVEDCGTLEKARPDLDLGSIRELGARIETIGSSIAAARGRIEASGLPLDRRLRLDEMTLAADRTLVDAEGLPGRPWYRHLLAAPGRDLGYGAEPLPGIADALNRGDRDAAQKAALRLGTGLGLLIESLQRLLAALEG